MTSGPVIFVAYASSVAAGYAAAYALFFRKKRDGKVTHGKLVGFLVTFIMVFISLLFASEAVYDWFAYGHWHH